jgi:hypothetical protein
MPEISRATGIEKETLYRWEKGAKPSDITLYTRLNDYLNNMELAAAHASISGDDRVVALRLPLTNNATPIPWLHGNISSGSIVVVDEKPELIVEPINGPFLSRAEGLIEINTESMEPTFKKGSRIAISRLKDGGELLWGECYYVINKRWQGFVRRLYEGENGTHLRLMSDHPDQQKYPPITLGLDRIEAICRIRAQIISY